MSVCVCVTEHSENLAWVIKVQTLDFNFSFTFYNHILLLF